MQYKGFEFYASEVPEELVGGLVAEGRAPIGARRVFTCEIYRAEDEEQKDVLKVFDLVVGKDIADDSDETLVFAMMGYIDDHYGELMREAFKIELNEGVAFDARLQEILNQIESGRITETANAVLCFDFENGQNVVCVDFCYDASENLPECDMVNLVTLPKTEENIAFAQALLDSIQEGWKVPVFDSVSAEIANDPKTKVFQVLGELQKLQEMAEYQVAAVMAYLDEHCEPEEPLTDDELYALAEKFVEASGSWFGTTASQQEYLTALGDLLESGIHRSSYFDKLGAKETRQLLLNSNEQVFGTLVEATAVENCFRYLPEDYKLSDEDMDAVERAVEKELVGNVGALIEDATERTVDVSLSGKEQDISLG